MIDRKHKGSGLGVIIFGITLLLILLFTAVNIVNSKVIQNGYISLRDTVLSASSGSVMHLLKTQREDSASGATKKQNQIILGDNYDLYLQLALGYIINRDIPNDNNNDTIVHTGEINNFIKLDHQKVVNSTMSLLEDAVIRDKGKNISDTSKYKILMFFIEPYRQDDGKKFFNIIAYGNGDYNLATNNIDRSLASTVVLSNDTTNMRTVYERVESEISKIVNANYIVSNQPGGDSYQINLNAVGNDADFNELVRKMETYPHYLIVVKDFALPTIFDGKDTVESDSWVKKLFKPKNNEPVLKTPMCALNTGKTERKLVEEDN